MRACQGRILCGGLAANAGVAQRENDDGGHQQSHDGRGECRHDRIAAAPAAETLDDGGPPRQDRPIGEEPPQILRHLFGAVISCGRFLGDRLEHDRFQVDGNVGVDSLGSRGRVVGDASEQLGATHVRKVGPQRQQFVERDPQAINIAAAIGPAFEPFGRRISQRPDKVAGLSELIVSFRLGQSKVRHPDIAFHIEQQVRRLDVAMQDALGVRVGQGFGGLKSDACHVAVELPAAGARGEFRVGPRRGTGVGLGQSRIVRFALCGLG